ncbi:protein FAM133-like [Arachis ipaensis]|nr:protein FAM133-like [Arachis ipaensis]
MFKRIFILYIQMAFLLSTTINKIFPVHLAPIFKMDTITEGNWRAHVLNLIIKGITDYNLKKKKAIDGCLFALMIVYFHLSKNKDKKREERPPEPWIANWTREQLVERMRAEMEEHMGIVKMAETKEKMKEIKKKEKKQKNQKNKKKRKASSLSSSETETTESEVDSTSEFETEEDSEDSTRKQPTRKAKKMESKKRKKIQEDSDSESESNDE